MDRQEGGRDRRRSDAVAGAARGPMGRGAVHRQRVRHLHHRLWRVRQHPSRRQAHSGRTARRLRVEAGLRHVPHSRVRPTVLGFRCDPNGRVRLFFRYAHGLHFDGTTPGSRNQGSDAEPPSLVRSPESSGFELAGADGVFHPATAAIFVDCDIDDLVNSKETCRLQRHRIRHSRQQPQHRHDYAGDSGCAGADGDAIRLAQLVRLRCSTTTACPRSRSVWT